MWFLMSLGQCGAKHALCGSAYMYYTCSIEILFCSIDSKPFYITSLENIEK